MSKKPVIASSTEGFMKAVKARAVLEDGFEIISTPGLLIPEHIRERTEVVVLADQKVTGAFMDSLPNLRHLARFGTGYDGVDLAAASARDIVVSRVSGVNASATAEHALLLLLSLARNAVLCHDGILRREWRHSLQGRSLSDLSIGVLGLGHVGRALVSKLKALGAENVLAWNRTPRDEVAYTSRKFGVQTCDTPEELFRESEAVVVCLALNEETRHFVSDKLILLMKPNALLVNISRGEIIEEEKIAWFIRTEKLHGVALDVYSKEPPFGHTFYEDLRALAEMGHNIILSPHIGAKVRGIENAVAEKVVDDILNVRNGNLRSVEVVN